MKKILLIILLLMSVNVYAAPPTRSFTYVSNTPIDPAQNNANENALYSYLQVGVDTYAPLSITGADISNSAAIAYNKLALTGTIVNADISAVAAIVDTKLAAISTAGKVSGAALTSLTAIPVGAGLIPVANIDTGTTANKILQLNGSSQIPAVSAALLTSVASAINDYGASTSSSTTRQMSAIKLAFGRDISVAGGGSQAITNLGFAGATSYAVICSANSSFSIPPAGTDQNAGNLVCDQDSGAQFTIYNSDDQTKTVSWIAIGI